MGGKAQRRSCRDSGTVQIDRPVGVFRIGGLQAKRNDACEQQGQQAGVLAFFQGKITNRCAQFSDGNRFVQRIEYRLGFVDKASEAQDLMPEGTLFIFCMLEKTGTKVDKKFFVLPLLLIS